MTSNLPFIDSYGMINSRPDEENAESSLLWTVENNFLGRSEASTDAIIKAINLCRIRQGIYDQNPSSSLPEADKYMSHDQLTAICAFSFKNDLSDHKDIWKEIVRQIGRYDNINPESPSWSRFLHPRDIIYYAYLNKNIFGYLFLPILFIILAVSCLSTWKNKEHTILATDGKLLTWVRCQAVMENSLIWRIFYRFATYIISKKFKNGWEGVFNTYFYYPGHPNRFE